MNITTDQYASLLFFAAAGAAASGQTPEYLELRSSIDSGNGIRRYTLLVKYQAVPQQIPLPGVKNYPPLNQITIELTRPVTKGDVDAALQGISTSPALTLVTTDPQGIVGWYDYNTYFGV